MLNHFNFFTYLYKKKCMEKCDYGCGGESKFFFKNGKGCCENSPNKCPAKRQRDSEKKKGKFNGIQYWNIDGFKKHAWNKGKTLIETHGIEASKKIKEKMSKNQKGGGRASTEEGEKERRKKLSEVIKKRYDNGWLPKAGRCEKIKYDSKYYGVVSLDGNWELSVAKYLDDNNIEWVRNKKRFKYYDGDKERFYTPDFYLVKENKFIEVKGYKTDLDILKWSQFPEELEVWDRSILISRDII